MARSKQETLSFRTTSEIKQLLKVAAEHEHRSQASMVEVLILEYAKQNNLLFKSQDETNSRIYRSNDI